MVLTYANDALQEVPANKNLVMDRVSTGFEGCKTPWTPMPKTPNLTCRAPVTPGLEFVPELPEGQPEPKDEAKRKESNALWVASNDQRKGKRTWHKVVKAGWQIPLSNWSTACGWNFTKNPHKVSMSVSLLFNQTRCRKCIELMKIRDRVKEGQMLADFIQNQSAPYFDK